MKTKMKIKKCTIFTFCLIYVFAMMSPIANIPSPSKDIDAVNTEYNSSLSHATEDDKSKVHDSLEGESEKITLQINGFYEDEDYGFIRAPTYVQNILNTQKRLLALNICLSLDQI